MQHDKTKWLDEALALVPSDIRRDADELLRPLLKRCNSKSRKTFWQWLRLTLAKDIETLGFLLYMQEHKLPPEVQETKAQGAEGFRYVTNNGTTLIEVIDGQDHAVYSRIKTTGQTDDATPGASV